MNITSNENRLLWVLRGLVEQHLENKNDIFNSEYIRINRDAMEILVEYGHMELMSADDHGGRWYQARMIPREQTPNAFGRDVDGGSGDPGEALANSAEALAPAGSS